MYKSLLLLSASIFYTTYGSADYLGSLLIENVAEATVEDSLIMVIVRNSCSGKDLDQRAATIVDAFDCLAYKTRAEGPNLAGLFFDSSNQNCFGNTFSLNDAENECIVGVAYDGLDQDGWSSTEGVCTTRSTAEADLPWNAAWGVDGLDSDGDENNAYDNEFTYYDLPNTVDLYILDTGVRGTHDEFADGQVVHLGLYAGSEYFEEWYIPAYHGTSGASNMGGISYGASSGQTIYNLNVAFPIELVPGTFGFLGLSTCYVLLALQDSYNNMVNTGRRGVINMSFGLGGLTTAQYELIEDLFEAIKNFGSINVASAGNGGSSFCGYPATSEHVLSVGAYDESLTLSVFSNYGDCVDVYGPGTDRHAAGILNDSYYRDVSGTSFSGPTVAGIVANYLLECEDTGYNDPCTLNGLKVRFNTEPYINIADYNQINQFACNDDSICNGVVYQCGVPLFPRSPEQCTSGSYCQPDEAGNCAIWHNNVGCSQCESGSFKKNFNYPCVNCQEYYGESCVSCQDYQGCAQCSPNNDFTRTYNPLDGLWYCQPSPCIDDDNNCQVCNNGFCSQCRYGYSLNADGKSCS